MLPKNIHVAVDGSAASEHALAYADNLAHACGARLEVVHVMTREGSYSTPQELKALAQLEHTELTEHDQLEHDAEMIARGAQLKIEHCPRERTAATVLHGEAATEIVRHASERGADLIVLSSRGLSGLKELLLGSVSHKVVQHAACPCMVIKAGA